MHHPTEFGTVEDVAKLLKLSPSYLTKLRLYTPEKSPPFVRVGRRVRYPIDGATGVLAWAAAKVGGAR